MARRHMAVVIALGASVPANAQVAHPNKWPAISHKLKRDPALESRVNELLARMSVEDKVGQIIQPDIASIKPDDLRSYKVGSVLNGGNSSPGDDEFAPPREWLRLADAFYAASMDRSDGRPRIPVIWGTDAVHGHNNLVGATLFPHNVGLGNARDPGLIRRIGAVTAEETAATGIGWSFAPTLAVVQDDRWGRTYESYSEEPAVVASYAGAMIEGLQGVAGTRSFMGPGHVIATAKHFLGDGGTGGRDQGDTRVSERTLIDVHAAGYPPAIAAGALTVMASFSSWNGAKMHGNASLLTGVLKQHWGFQGLVVGDWNAHAQLPGCTVDHCPAAINAGLDMFMAGSDWKALYRNTLADVRAGTIPMTRLDDAVRRILRVKALSGALDAGAPSTRPPAGQFGLLGSPEHRAVARQAVRESLVLLKNENGLLPLRPEASVLVAGGGANSVSQQSGGWTITWQGTGVSEDKFPNGQSIWSGIRQAVAAAGGSATLAADGRFSGAKPDAAIVVFGETPYAEFAGDRPTLEYSPGDKSDLALLKRLRAAGVPVVAVFLSGRPLWVNAELNASDAFVAAFLPGTEGGGVADLLFRKADGSVAHDFRGRLSFSWPRRPDQFTLNRRDVDYDPLFAFGYGLTYAAVGHVPRLDETRPAGLAAEAGPWFGRGRPAQGWRWELSDSGSPAVAVTAAAARSAHLAMIPVDRRAQEDARRLVWDGGGAAEARLTPPAALDLTRESNGELSLVMEARVERAPAGAVALAQMDATGRRAAVPLAGLLRDAKPGEWVTIAVPLRCFGPDPRAVAVPFALSTAGALTMALSDVRVASVANASGCGRS